MRAPSAGFSQGWACQVLDQADDARGLGGDDAERDSWLSDIMTAPLIVVPSSFKEVYLDRYAQ